MKKMAALKYTKYDAFTYKLLFVRNESVFHCLCISLIISYDYKLRYRADKQSKREYKRIILQRSSQEFLTLIYVFCVLHFNFKKMRLQASH